jgi:hypothetical protein
LEAEYSPPRVLTPRQSKALVQQDVITTLSPPQSPAATVATRSKQKIKDAEVDQICSIGMTIETEIKEAEHVTMKSRNFDEVSSNIDFVVQSSNIEVLDMKPKIMLVSSSPPIPFHKQQLATPRLNIANDDKTEAAVLPQLSKDDINSNRSDTKTFEGVLRMFFVCYIAAVAFFFFIMCRSLFHQHANTHGVAPDVPLTGEIQVATVATIDTNKLGFLQAIWHFNLQHLLPLNAVKEILSDNKHILDTIGQELSKMIHDNTALI